GSELGWTSWAAADAIDYAAGFFRYVVFSDPGWDYRTLKYEDQVETAVTAGRVLDATDPDLRAFVKNGGKLLLYAGWNDPRVSPRSTMRYYESVVAKVGATAARDAVRLFMA